MPTAPSRCKHSKSIIGTDRSDQEAFRVHVNSAADELFISKPMIQIPSGKRAIVITRRITASDGTFAGGAAAFLDPGQMTKHVGAIDLGQDATLALVGLDGVGLQIVRDWVLRFNVRGPDGLLDGKHSVSSRRCR